MIKATPASIDANGTITLMGMPQGSNQLEKPKFSLPVHSMINEEAGGKGASCLLFIIFAVVNLVTLFIPLIIDIFVGACDFKRDKKIYEAKLEEVTALESHKQMVEAVKQKETAATTNIQNSVEPKNQQSLARIVKALITVKKHLKAAKAQAQEAQEAKIEKQKAELAEKVRAHMPLNAAITAISKANTLRERKLAAHRGVYDVPKARKAHYTAYAEAQRLMTKVVPEDQAKLPALEGMDPKYKLHYHSIMSS